LFSADGAEQNILHFLTFLEDLKNYLKDGKRYDILFSLELTKGVCL